MGSLKLHIEAFWPALIDMRSFLQEAENVDHGYVCLIWDGKFKEWQFFKEELVSVESHCILIPLRDQKDLFIKRLYNSYYSVVNPKFSKSGESFWLTNHTLDDLSGLEMYLAFVLEEFFARRNQTCFVLEHRKLEDQNNEVESMHFHRLRSLFDGVMIGWRDALEIEQLDNSLVAGEMPAKIILDLNGDLIDYIEDIAMFYEGAPTYFVVANEKVEKEYAKYLPVGTDVFVIGNSKESYKNFFAQKGINSLLIEGINLI